MQMTYRVYLGNEGVSLQGVDALVDFARKTPKFRIDPRTMYCLYSYSPHPFGYATEHLDFRVIGRGQWMLFPYSRPLTSGFLDAKAGMALLYGRPSIKTVATMRGDGPLLTSYTKLLDPYRLIDPVFSVEVSAARLAHEVAVLDSYRRERIDYPNAPIYAYEKLCRARMTNIKLLTRRLNG